MLRPREGGCEGNMFERVPGIYSGKARCRKFDLVIFPESIRWTQSMIA